MHTIPVAAKPSDGNGMDERVAPKAAVRVCVYGIEAPSDKVLAALKLRMPASAQLALFGACAASAAWPDAERATDIEDAWHPTAIAIAAANRFPGENLLLVRADLDLPEFACERLLRALDCADVLGAIALDSVWRRPLPLCEVSDIDPLKLDALCFAYSDRQISDDPVFFMDAPAWFSAWHGGRLSRLGADNLRDKDAIDAAGLRIAMLDHVYVETGSLIEKAVSANLPGARDPRDPEPPSVLEPLRERIAAALKTAITPAQPGLDAKPVLLHVLHGWGGGAERWVRDFAAADHDAHHLVLIARGSVARQRQGEWLELHDGSLVGPPLRRFPLPRPIADTALGDAAYRELLQHIVRDCCIDAIVVSSLIGHSLDALRTGLPLFWIVHDHYPLWPILHRDFGNPALFFDDAQRACDLTGTDSEFANREPQHWRTLRDETVAALRAARATLVAPSRSALANQLRLAPELRDLPTHIVPHGLAPWPTTAPAAIARPAHDRLRLLVPGRIRRGKGAHLLLAALPRLRDYADLFLVGAGADAHELFGESGVHIVLDYRRDDLPRLLGEIQPDAALLLPTVAETFSYTLSELRSLGVPVIATRIGALAERIEDGIDGFLVDPDASAVIARVAEIAIDPGALATIRATLAQRSATTPAEMAQAYTAIMQLGARALMRYPLTDVDGGMLEAAVSTDALQRARENERVTAAQLDATRAENERRGDWGHELDRDLTRARKQLSTLDGELSERTRWALALNTELEDIKPRYEQILVSLSWRITAPLRNAKARARTLRTSLAFHTLKLRGAIGRTRGSLAQRGVTGTFARIAQELRGGANERAGVVYAAPQDDFAPFAVPTSDHASGIDRDPGLQQDRLHQRLPALARRACRIDSVRGDRRRRRLVGRDAAAPRRCRRHPQRAQCAEPRFHRLVQRRRRDRARRLRAVPQQRHDRDRAAGSKRSCAASRKCRTPAWSARSWSIRTAACRKPAASCSATARAGTTDASRTPAIRATTSAARSTTAPAPRSFCVATCSTGSADSMRVTRRRITKTPISRSRCARPDSR